MTAAASAANLPVAMSAESVLTGPRRLSAGGQSAAKSAARSSALDSVRGLAVLLMIVDHATLVFGGPELIRLTLGRVAMPLFFILGGYLCRRMTYRHALIAAVGIGLPLIVPWIDNPNVLIWYVGGCGLLVLCKEFGIPLWPVVLIALGMAANGFHPLTRGTSYDGLALVAMMALGSMLAPAAWRWADRIPSPLRWLGRWPLSIYVGHLLVLQGAIVAGLA